MFFMTPIIVNRIRLDIVIAIPDRRSFDVSAIPDSGEFGPRSDSRRVRIGAEQVPPRAFRLFTWSRVWLCL